MARIVRFHEFGGPEVLRLDEVEVPPPGPGQARLRIGAIGLNRIETIYRAGWFGPVRFPATIGYEAAGVVESVGPGVTSFAPGDRVATLPGLSMEQYGTNGELILYPADMLVAVPPGLSMTDAAATWMQYLTAYSLVAIAAIRAGDHVVITAASSSVGIAAIQIAKAAGAHPIAVTRRRDKAAALQALGASHVIVSEEEDIAARIAEISGGGARIVFDAVGGAGLPALVSSLRPGGILLLYGTLAGDEIHLPAHVLMLGNLTLRGFSANSLVDDPEQRAKALAYIADGLATGALRPVVAKRFPFEDFAAAHAFLESNAQIGKVVVTTASAGE